MKYNPPAGSQDPDAKYVTGQPGKVRGSAVPAEAVEHPQREIVEVIKKAGLDPDGDDLTQLWQAIGQIISTKAPIATKKKPGLVQIGDGLAITPEGLLSVLIASTSQAGLVKPRYGLKIGKDGSLDVDFGDMPTDKFEALLKSIRVPIWLTKNLTIYVSPTGSNTLDEGRGLTADKPFATLGYALQYISTTFNLYLYNVDIRMAAGVYPRDTISFPDYTTTSGTIRIFGASEDPDETIIGGILCNRSGTFQLFDLTCKPVDDPNYQRAINCSAGMLYLTNITVDISETVVPGGGLGGLHTERAGTISIQAGNENRPRGVKIKVGDVKTSSLLSSGGGVLQFSADIEIVGDCIVDTATASTSNGGTIYALTSSLAYPGRHPVITANGTITGKRYQSIANGIINTNGGGAEFFPGSEAGRTSAGGQYI